MTDTSPGQIAIAHERDLPLDDLTDLKAVVTHLTSDEGKDDLEGIGGVSKATAGVILRQLAVLYLRRTDYAFGISKRRLKDRRQPQGPFLRRSFRHPFHRPEMPSER